MTVSPSVVQFPHTQMGVSVYCLAIPVAMWPAFGCALLFAVLWAGIRLSLRGSGSFYFDDQDFFHYENGRGRQLPLSAPTGTFAAHLANYLGVTKLLITVAAASIAFGSGKASNTGVFVAKIILAFSILYGAVFVALLQFFYEEYAHDVRCYTPCRSSLIRALGFSTLVCFIAGYLWWACNLG